MDWLTCPKILVGDGAQARGKVKAIWLSQTVQNRLRSLTQGKPWLWDGNKNAWYAVIHFYLVPSLIFTRCSVDVPEQRFTVDLDAEKGRPRNPPQTTYVIIRRVRAIRMAIVQAYLARQIPFDNTILECISK